ncbi:MAG: helix-turn-helix transcriptional regulator [Gammaproteobacteria bacterium]|jgi:transcriptional regulator with XRE-family HTH domain
MDLSSAEEKGRRLQQLRKLARFSQKEVASLINISLSAYKGWENGRHGGLPKRRAIFLLPIFQAEGIECNLEWLMSGIGEPPQKNLVYSAKKAIKAKDNIMQAIIKTEQERIQDELRCFRSNYLDSIDFVTPDDAMAPMFLPQDVVAGVKLKPKYYANAFGMPCIVQLTDGTILLRELRQGKEKDHYTLLCSNIETNQNILNEVELINVAPVLWHRRKQLTLK